jgi:GMP synthase-like glutamine amidotransferase
MPSSVTRDASMTMTTLHYLQHVPDEPPGMILDWAIHRKLSCLGTLLFKGENLPAVTRDDIVVVMGGPMAVHDEETYPWLRREKSFLFEIIKMGVPVIGVCLGAQLVAAVLGAKVVRNPFQEFGFSPVQVTREAARSALFCDLPRSFSPLHWHNDTFAIPEGAVRIAGNDACMNQGFMGPGRVLALQFHLEATPDLVDSWVKTSMPSNDPNNIADDGQHVQRGSQILESAMQLTPENRIILYTLLDRFCFT